MKARLFWLASVLVATSAFSTNVACAADDVVIHATSESCPSCGTGSKLSFGNGLGIFHRKSSCSACGDHAWLNWHPGQVVGSLHASASAKLHSIKDSLHFPAPTCAGAKAAQPIPPAYMYNPYYRSPRDYFMSEH
jgi:hypothetical protein